MMNQPDQNDKEREPKAGSRLGRALGGLRKESVFISPVRDEAVLAEANAHLAQLRLRRQRAQWIALAACLVALAIVAQTMWHRGSNAEVYAREDLNHDGRVDILDAFQLAREIKNGKAQVKREDFNGDGKVDEADVEILAKRAVSVEKDGRS